MKLIRELLEDGDFLFLAVGQPDGRVVVAVNPAYTDPGEFGVLLADMVRHLTNAYIKEGYDPRSVRNSILSALGAELDWPTDTPRAIQEAGDAPLPQG